LAIKAKLVAWGELFFDRKKMCQPVMFHGESALLQGDDV
jgi:hypothetical protein